MTKGKQIFISSVLMSLMTMAFAVPEVVINDPKTGQPLPSQPINNKNNSVIPTNPISNITAPTHNPNQPTLAQLNTPNQEQLSKANEKLLADNAELKRQVDSLNTQVNVLINEHSGQLFIYGSATVIISLLIGIFIGKLIFSRKGNW